MKPQVKKVAGVLASATLLSSGAVAAVAPLMPDGQAEATPAYEQVADQAQAPAKAKAVQGEFSYTQETVSSNADIANVFRKAAAQLCASGAEDRLGDAVELVPSVIQICNECGLVATIDLGDESDDFVSRQMACSCASNLPGGGAIANADVSGTSIEALVAMARA